MPYLLDTNSWIHYLKHATSPLRARLRTLQPREVVSCSVVRGELLHGAEKYGHPDRRKAAVLQTLAPFQSAPFDDDAATLYAQIRHSLEVAGKVIGPHDLQIAAICILHGFTLVTNNTGARLEGHAEFDHFLGAEEDLIRNIHGVAKVAELDGDEVGYLVGKVAEIKGLW